MDSGILVNVRHRHSPPVTARVRLVTQGWSCRQPGPCSGNENTVRPSDCVAAAGLGRAATARLTPENVSKLAPAWIYDTRDPVAPLGGNKPPAFEATPAYADGRLYLSTPLGTVVALNAATGAELWRAQLDVRTDIAYSDPANRGPTLHGDRLYVGTIDARLVCLQRTRWRTVRALRCRRRNRSENRPAASATVARRIWRYLAPGGLAQSRHCRFECCR